MDGKGQSIWRKRLASVVATLGAMGIWIAAVVALQPTVTPPPLPITQVADKRWELVADYRTQVAVSGRVYHIEIPAGFRCDLASVGVLDHALGISNDHPAIRRGALVHDYLYRMKPYPREVADLILYHACLADGMARDKAKAVYEAVRLWGFEAWR